MEKKRKRVMLKFLKINLWITILFFLAYLLAAFGKGDYFFADDFRNKKAVAGSVVSAMIRIFGVPDAPTITGNYNCSPEGLSSIRLDWTTDEDATHYDVYRDEVLLIFDLTENFYVDQNVADEVSYDYYVVARGPAGSTASVTISIATQRCNSQLIPLVAITTFDGKNVFDDGQQFRTKNRTPGFIGTTNIENALIELEIQGEQSFFATTVANSNGTWYWVPNSNLKYGSYVIYVKAISPSDGSISANCFLFFDIYEDSSSEDEKDKKKETKQSSKAERDDDFYQRKEKPFEFDLSLENSVYIKGVSMDEEAYRGESLKVGLQFSEITMENRFMEISYELIDPERAVVAKYSDRVLMKKNMLINKEIYLPYEFKLGEYRLKINATVDGLTVSHEGYFNLVDRPILRLGAVGYITYADIVENLGWLAIWSTLFLGFFSILTIWEHHLYKRGRFHITESILRKRGLID